MKATPKDLYDIWFLLNRGIKPSSKMINRKFSLCKKKFSVEKFSDSNRAGQVEEEARPRPLLSSAPRFERCAGCQRGSNFCTFATSEFAAPLGGFGLFS